MLRKLFALLCLYLTGTSVSQAQQVLQRDSLYRNTDFEIISAKFYSLRSTAPQSGIVVDLSKQSKVKGSLPIHQGNLDAWYFDAELGSNNDYVPLFDKGKWATNAIGAFSYTVFLNRDNRYWGVDSLAILGPSFLKPTQTFWIWLNAKAGYNLNSFLFANDNPNNANSYISRQTYHNIFGQVNAGFYFDPFKTQFTWLSFAGNVGFEYRQNDHNYASMQTVRINSLNTVGNTAPGGTEVEIESEKTSAKHGRFIVANTPVVNYNVNLLVNSYNNITFGVNFFGRTRLAEALRSTDIGVGVNLPVHKIFKAQKRIMMNLNLEYQVPDVTNNLGTNARYSDKGILSLGVAIPVYSLTYKK
ncbi:hypothetical protein EOD41_12000 [Mucilaginibacter limnophilus]|uniref:Porin n=1 Tax=Mucilaginibacter limnophilus TaxID=1932778 RepID=A0A3S2WY00_9SPHI|nr:hypothetical protein [Mucilaginibacter limnophilus]RVU00710.1 hypothetical protein EOD41_12000 [Mucilaginibacter limnophilus]